MPIYEYRCNKCGEFFSRIILHSQSCDNTVCPRCGSKQVKKLLSQFCCPADSGSSSGGSMSGFGTGGG